MIKMSRDRDASAPWGDGLDDTTQLGRMERMLIVQGRMLLELLRRSGIDHNLEIQLMADFSALNDKVSKMTDLAASFKTMTDGLKAQRDAAQAEVDALKAADSTDQASVDAATAKLSEVNAALEAVTAVAAGTPVAGSTGGITA